MRTVPQVWAGCYVARYVSVYEKKKKNQSGLRASSFMLWTNCIVKLNAGNLNQRGKKTLLKTGGVS